MHPHRFGTGTVTNDPSVVVQTSPRHPPQELAREPRLPTRPSSAHPRRAPPAEAFASPGRRGSTRRGLRAPHGRTPHLPRARWRRRGWCVSSRHRACARRGLESPGTPAVRLYVARRGVGRRGRAGRARRSPGSTAQCRHAPRARGAALFRDPHNPRTAGASSRRWTARGRSTRAGVVRNRHRARSTRTGSHPSPGYSAHPARPVAHHPRPLDVAPGVAPSGEARGLSAPRRGVARVTGEAIPPEPAAPVPRSTSPGAELHPRLTPRERALGTYRHIVARAARRSSPLCVYCVCVCPTARHTL